MTINILKTVGVTEVLLDNRTSFEYRKILSTMSNTGGLVVDKRDRLLSSKLCLPSLGDDVVDILEFKRT